MHFLQAEQELSPDVVERVSVTADDVLAKLQGLVAYLPLLAVSLLLVGLFVLLARFLGSRRALYDRLNLNPFATDLVRQAVMAATVLVGVLIALDLLEATALVGAALGAAGVLGIAVGFAFRDLVENFIASILLSIRQPFAPDDHVVIGSEEGKVLRLTSRATILMTLDGNHLRVPNAQVFKGVILNYTRNPLRRFTFDVGVGVGEDLIAAQALGVATLAGIPGVVTDPEPQALIIDLGDSSVLLRFAGWVDQRRSSFAKVRSEAIRRVKSALEEAGMDLPEPTYRVQMVEAPAPRERPESRVQAPTDLPTTAERDAVQDLGPEHDLERQLAEDRATDPGLDLLDPEAPRE